MIQWKLFWKAVLVTCVIVVAAVGVSFGLMWLVSSGNHTTIFIVVGGVIATGLTIGFYDEFVRDAKRKGKNNV